MWGRGRRICRCWRVELEDLHNLLPSRRVMVGARLLVRETLVHQAQGGPIAEVGEVRAQVSEAGRWHWDLRGFQAAVHRGFRLVGIGEAAVVGLRLGQGQAARQHYRQSFFAQVHGRHVR